MSGSGADLLTDELARRPARFDRLRLLLERRTSRLALVVFAAFVLFVAVFPLVSPHGANDVDFAQSREGPSLEHPLGTDQFGRDLLTRIAAGGQTSLAIAFFALLVILATGFVWGTTSALLGGKVDAAMMRIVDGLFAIPRLPVAIVILVVLSLRADNIFAIVVALSVAGWMLTARLVRGHVLTLKGRDYIGAARALGATWPQIARRHVLPNSLGILLVAVFLELPTVILGEAFLSVLGLGPQPPTSTWGTMAQDGWHFFRAWEMFVATAAIATFALTANILADSLQEALDPRRRLVRTRRRPRWRFLLAFRRG